MAAPADVVPSSSPPRRRPSSVPLRWMAAVCGGAALAALAGIVSEYGWLWGHPERGGWLAVGLAVSEAALAGWWVSRLAFPIRVKVAVGWAIVAIVAIVAAAVPGVDADARPVIAVVAAGVGASVVCGIVCLLKGRTVVGWLGILSWAALPVGVAVSVAVVHDSWAPAFIGSVVGVVFVAASMLLAAGFALAPARVGSRWRRARAD